LTLPAAPPIIELAAPAPAVPPLVVVEPVGAATTTAAARRHPPHAPGDPMESFNRRMWKIHWSIDHAVLRPAAMGYQHAVPRPIRSGLRHFFSNLGEPVVFANFVLQFKPKSAARTVVRFLINSTIGLAGTIDVARGKAFELPHQPNSLGDTLGFYGVKPGPYLFIPLIGPTDFRDLIGGQVDGLLLPIAVGKPFDQLEYGIAREVITGLDLRAESDGELHALLDDALDPYATLRSVYLQDRAGEIAALKGKAADVSMPGDLKDPAASAIPAAPASTAPELQDPLADPATASPQPETPTPKPAEPSSTTDEPAAAVPKAPAQR